jgi:hypothetical protein
MNLNPMNLMSENHQGCERAIYALRHGAKPAREDIRALYIRIAFAIGTGLLVGLVAWSVFSAHRVEFFAWACANNIVKDGLTCEYYRMLPQLGPGEKIELIDVPCFLNGTPDVPGVKCRALLIINASELLGPGRFNFSRGDWNRT